MTSSRSITLVFFLLVCCIACKNKALFSENYIPQKEMAQILIDVNIAESYSMMAKDSLHRAGAKDIDSLAVYYNRIFDHYHITKEQFNESLDWYKNHPDKLDSVYNGMIATITKWQNSVQHKR